MSGPTNAPNYRRERIGEEIQHELAAMVAGELKDPRLEVGLTVNAVQISDGMKHVRAFIGVQGNEKERADAIKALEHAAGFIRRELVTRLNLRRAPELHFVLDLSQEYTERIEELLREVKKDKPAVS